MIPRCAHNLNAVVCEGMKEIDEAIIRVRNIVRYVRSSPSRMANFKECVEKEGIMCNTQPCLDVPTRWNSTYFMLDRALQYQKAFERLAEDETYFHLNMKEDEIGEEEIDLDVDEGENDIEVDERGRGKGKGKGKVRRKAYGAPTSSDWMMAKLYVKFLKLFYNATLRFSGSLYVTSNSFFMEIILIKKAIKKLFSNKNDMMRLLASGMRLKFDKYWGKLDKINVIAFGDYS